MAEFQEEWKRQRVCSRACWYHQDPFYSWWCSSPAPAGAAHNSHLCPMEPPHRRPGSNTPPQPTANDWLVWGDKAPTSLPQRRTNCGAIYIPELPEGPGGGHISSETIFLPSFFPSLSSPPSLHDSSRTLSPEVTCTRISTLGFPPRELSLWQDRNLLNISDLLNPNEEFCLNKH